MKVDIRSMGQNHTKQAPIEQELTKEATRALTAAEFEQHNRSYIFKNIMKRNDLTQE